MVSIINLAFDDPSKLDVIKVFIYFYCDFRAVSGSFSRISKRAGAGWFGMAFGGWGQAVVRRIGAVIYTGIQNSTLIYYRDASVPPGVYLMKIKN
jgi:hypothetical protein